MTPVQIGVEDDMRENDPFTNGRSNDHTHEERHFRDEDGMNAKRTLDSYSRWMQHMSLQDAKLLQGTKEFAEFERVMERLQQLHQRMSLPALSAAVNDSLGENDIDMEQAQIFEEMNGRKIYSGKHARPIGLHESELNTNYGGTAHMVNPGSPHPSDLPMRSVSSRHSGTPFLQHVVSDDVLIRILDYLHCRSLPPLSETCLRLYEITHRVARQRSSGFGRRRQLQNPMQLLRAQEQWHGMDDGGTEGDHFVENESYDTITESYDGQNGHTTPRRRVMHVSMPTLLLRRRVRVTGCGDEDYNGIYHCTEFNGNGFVFSKPRFRHQPQRTIQSSLRCIIAKRFSNEIILWYLSKEIVVTEEEAAATVTVTRVDGTLDGAGVADHDGSVVYPAQAEPYPHEHQYHDTMLAGESQEPLGQLQQSMGWVKQVFSFWAKLMVIGDGSPDICRYPSQTSRLMRGTGDGVQGGWQCLASTRTMTPPTVELLD